MRASGTRSVFLAMIPVHLLILGWVWIGRAAFGNGGWMTLILLVTVIPVVALALALTTLLSFRRRPAPRALTARQVRAQLVTWAGLFVVGLFMYDFTDAPESDKTVLTQLFGYSDALFTLSAVLIGVGAITATGGWVWLLSELLRDQTRLAVPTGVGHD
ncbi:hypothetical protein BA895_19630 [Humibacillus sp. DSM 29435]|uniref:hypothetical protein n=1 Tax=Humibacillus sp. DSM 29435 TaxID=1869167 RepID=UPI000872592D|nr:hypothetical protein [Humibacillus sp. DSM 29435]OFE16266.1 hypothetical protein BA895_19630 [Humibacillus sp. DSM 29435]